MRPSPHNILDLQEDDLQRLISDEVPEDADLEYKGNRYDKTREFCKDVSAMANTRGGVILIGIHEEDHLPKELVGIEEVAKEQQRLTQAAEANIKPRVLLAWKAILLGNGKHVLAVGTMRSRLAPHMNYADDDKRFHKRANEITTVMDERELRQACLQSTTQEEMVAEIHRGHVKRVLGDPNVGSGNPVIMVDVVPVPIDEIRFDPADTTQLRAVRDLEPALGEATRGRISFDGWARKSLEKRDNIRVTRSGAIRSCAEETMQSEGRWILASVPTVEGLFRFLREVAVTYHSLKIEPPVYLCMTIARCAGMTLARGWQPIESHAVDVDLMEFQPILWEDLGEPVEGLARPWLDRLWQAFGIPWCPYYEEDTGLPLEDGLRRL